MSGSAHAAEAPGSVPNLFRIPHSRMKELLQDQIQQLREVTDFSSKDEQSLQTLLQEVYEAMWEMKSHEYIENHFIMDRLKARLQAKKEYNELVCNCHEDSKLLGVIRLVERVYSARNEEEKDRFGKELQKSIQEFLEEFVHHMEEEEAVFQPLLSENFNSRELVDMNEMVLKQHTLFRQKVKSEKSLSKAIKRKRDDDVFDKVGDSLEDFRFRKTYCQEVNDFYRSEMPDNANGAPSSSAGSSAQQKSVNIVHHGFVDGETGLARLPHELLLPILSYLSPKDLLRLAQTSKRLNQAALASHLWSSIFPTQWAKGLWTFQYVEPKVKDMVLESSSLSLATSSESLNSTTSSEHSSTDSDIAAFSSISSKENRILNGIASHLLPKVGHGVSRLVLSASKGITNKHVQRILTQCHNLRSLDLSYTNISQHAFKNLAKMGSLRRLEEINLAGCRFLNDSALECLAECFLKRRRAQANRMKRVNLSGCQLVTSYGLTFLEVYRQNIEELDLSGIYMLDGETLSGLVQGCRKLQPQKLAYCNDIEDGPYPSEASGCLNLECDYRFCCQQLQN